MTTQDVKEIVAAIQPLDEFAGQTPVPRAWHAQWQMIFQRVVAKVEAIAAKKPIDKDNSPPP